MRTPEQIREHYLVEKELADRLREAPRERRRQLYGELYDELFRRVPHHSQLDRKSDPAAFARSAKRQMGLVARFLKPDMAFAEIGAGDGALAMAVASRVKKVVAIEVSKEILDRAGLPANFDVALTDGVSVPLAEASIDMAYSNQVMEHLHPDDALEQLRGIYRALKPGGIYLCVTPNRLTGPSDISRHFDIEATCFHLKEYTYSELADLFALAGFRKSMSYTGAAGWYVRSPLWVLRLVERALLALPVKLRSGIARCLPVRLGLDIRLAAVK